MKAIYVVAFSVFIVIFFAFSAQAEILGEEEMMAAMEQSAAAKTTGSIDFDTSSTQEAMDYFSSWGEYALKFDYWRAHAPAEGTLRLFYGSLDTKLDPRSDRGSFQARHIATVPGVYLFAMEGCDECVAQAELLATRAGELAERVYDLRGRIQFDIDGDPNVYVLIYPFEGKESRYGGYVWYNDMQPFEYGSNGAEIMHLNSDYTRSLHTLSQTFVHELTHLVHLSRDFRKDSWILEGYAEYTEYSLSFRPSEYSFSPPLEDGEYLSAWVGKFRQYESAFRFVKWIFGHFGDEVGQKLFEDTYNGQSSVLRVLNNIRWDIQYTWDDIWYEYRFCRRADFNGDFRVDDSDWIAMSDRMRDNSTDPKYDLNGDGVVGPMDLIWLENRQMSGSVIFEPKASSIAAGIRNYPNPFNAQTTVAFSVADRGQVRVEVFNAVGQLVSELYHGMANPGLFQIQWDGSGASSGQYFVRVEVSGQVQTSRMTLFK